ncbi:MAG: carbohydrate ABC transporter permease [Spirochaetes bacterium]|nr:MAG: carbohydrate ABC transporter permease [Spirochaetota bacterium]
MLARMKIGSFAKYFILVTSAILTLFPFLWILMSSFKTTNEIYESPFKIPDSFLFSNYITAWNDANIWIDFFNSAIVSISTVAILLLISAMASYILARIWKNFAMSTFFALGITVPYYAIIIPIFITMTKIGLYNTRMGLLLIYVVSNMPISIFILTGFMKGFPKEIEEAAWIDGASMSRTFFTIVLPLSKHGMATIGILGFMYSWNDFFIANILISNPVLKTITQGIQNFQGAYQTNYGAMFAAMIIAILPVVIAYLIFQEQIIEGMTAGAVKG